MNLSVLYSIRHARKTNYQSLDDWMTPNLWVLIKQSDETYFSLSPSHLETKSADDTDKNVELLASVATALAK